MNDLDSGLYLPIRFSQSQSEQDRYKRHSKGVALTELNYIYLDCSTLAPFQLRYTDLSAFTGVTMSIICADSGESVNIPFVSENWDDHPTNSGSNYLTYLGGDSIIGLSNGLFYIKVDVVMASDTVTMYSDLFMINNCGSTPYETEEYRIHSTSDGANYRAIDVTDLRIIK